MPELNRPDPIAAGDVVVRHRLGPLLAWAISLSALGFLVLVSVGIVAPPNGAPQLTWFDWMLVAGMWAAAGVFAWILTRAAITRLTLGADGSVRLATRTLFGARDRRLEPGSVARVELRRNPFGLVRGWQVTLHPHEGGPLVVSERLDAAAQTALAEEIARRLGVGGEP